MTDREHRDFFDEKKTEISVSLVSTQQSVDSTVTIQPSSGLTLPPSATLSKHVSAHSSP